MQGCPAPAGDKYRAGGLGKILPFPGQGPTGFTELGLGFELGGEEEMSSLRVVLFDFIF